MLSLWFAENYTLNLILVRCYHKNREEINDWLLLEDSVVGRPIKAMYTNHNHWFLKHQHHYFLINLSAFVRCQNKGEP